MSRATQTRLVTSFLESGGAILQIGAIADTQFLKRSAKTVTSGAGGGGGGTVAGVTGTAPIVVDNTDPTNPIVTATYNAANGILKYGAGGALTAPAGAGNWDLSALTGTFATPTGTNTLSGNTVLAAGKNLSMTAGAGNVDFSAATGTFDSPTGTNTLRGNVVVAAGKNISMTAGAGAVDFSAATGIFKSSGGAHTLAASAASSFTTSAGALTLTSAAAATWSTAAGALTLNGTGGLNFQTAGVTRVSYAADGTSTVWTQGVATSGSPTFVTWTGAAHTTLAAGTEAILMLFDLGQTVQFATGAIALQRAYRINAPTYAFVGASTITTATTVSIGGAPTAGANATITTALALNVVSGLTRLGGGVTIVGDLTQATGAVSLAANAASSLTTSSGALTMTSAAAATWSTAAGALTLTSAAAATWSTTAGILTLSGNGGVTCVSGLAAGSASTDFIYNSTNTRTAGKLVDVQNNTSSRFTIDFLGSVIHTQTAQATGTPVTWQSTAGAHTNLTASTEVSDINFNLARTVQWATGALATQRAVVIQAPTYAFVGATTVTNAATLAISGPPIAGTSATLTNTYSLWLQSGDIALAGGRVVFTAAGSSSIITIPNNSLTYQSGLNAGSTSADHIIKGTATRTAGSLVEVRNNNTARWNISYTGGMVVAQGAGATGTLQLLSLTGGSHTNQTLSTEIPFVDVNQGTVQWATGALTTQRCYLFQAPTLAFVGASTVTDTATVAISNAPQAGTNATLTRTYALWVQAGGVRLDGTTIGFYGTAPATKPTVSGSRAGNAALASLLTGLAGLGLVTDSSSA